MVLQINIVSDTGYNMALAQAQSLYVMDFIAFRQESHQMLVLLTVSLVASFIFKILNFSLQTVW